MEDTNTGMLTLEEQFNVQRNSAEENFLERARLANDAWVKIQHDQQILKFKQEMSRIFGVYVGDIKDSKVELFGVTFFLSYGKELSVGKSTVTGKQFFSQKVTDFASFWAAYHEVTEKASQASGVELIKACSKWWSASAPTLDYLQDLVEVEPLARFVHDLYAKSGDSLKVDSTIEHEFVDPTTMLVPTFHIYTDGFTEQDLELLSKERNEGFGSAQFIWHPMSSAPR